VEAFLENDPSPRAIFLNSPHNPTGGVALEEDIREIARLIQGRPVALLSDEPYDQMVWQGKHFTPLMCDGMIDQCVSAYTMSKSYSMSGWRIGFAVAHPRAISQMGLLLNTSLSCVPPFVQRAAAAALNEDNAERDRRMKIFHQNVSTLVDRLNRIDGVRCLEPAGTFYAFPNVAAVCNRLGITSQGLAMYVLEGADDHLGVACLGGECFGEAGHGFLRFSCSEPEDRLCQAAEFLGRAFRDQDRANRYVASRPAYRLERPYPAH
jgi:aspartate aminotransferase